MPLTPGFWPAQFLETRRPVKRFIEGIWGIFGHGNVAALGKAIVDWRVERGYFFMAATEHGRVAFSGWVLPTPGIGFGYVCLQRLRSARAPRHDHRRQLPRLTCFRTPVAERYFTTLRNRIPDPPCLQNLEQPLEESQRHDALSGPGFQSSSIG